MNYASLKAPRTDLGKVVLAPFAAIWDLLIRMAEASSYNQAIQSLNQLSDADLAARGTTRSNEVSRLFAGRFYL